MDIDPTTQDASMDRAIAVRLKALRGERGWSLEQLAGASGVSRATLSRIEKAEVSPTASVLGKLSAAFGLTLSRLMQLVETDGPYLVRAGDQPLWVDPETGFRRRSVSPPSRALAGEALACELPAGTRLTYDAPPRQGLEHHLVLQAGALAVTVHGERHRLEPGDCLRYQLTGPSAFEAPPDCAAAYLLFIV